jgi:hypothetical protein
MRLKDIRMFCRVCSVEIQLSVFQKTGLMGLHDQYTHVHDICNLCYQKEKDKNPDSGTSDSGISLAEPEDGGPNR